VGGKILVAGDVHANFNQLGRLTAVAQAQGISVIAQVGDFGYWPHIAADNRSLRRHNARLAQAGITLVFIDGNHENFEALFQDRPTVPGTPFKVIDTNILYAPRGSSWSWDGVRFLALGGAHSADIPYRRAAERKRRKSAQKSRWFWWAEETLTDEDVERAHTAGRADVLLCHDAPSSSNLKVHVTDVRDGYKEDPDTWDNRARVQRVLESARPKLVLHGHYHTRYSSVCGGFDFETRCEGLGADISKSFADSCIILDLPALRVHALDLT
jgi:Icc-related predicted phosphoesterase